MPLHCSLLAPLALIVLLQGVTGALHCPTGFSEQVGPKGVAICVGFVSLPAKVKCPPGHDEHHEKCVQTGTPKKRCPPGFEEGPALGLDKMCTLTEEAKPLKVCQKGYVLSRNGKVCERQSIAPFKYVCPDGYHMFNGKAGCAKQVKVDTVPVCPDNEGSGGKKGEEPTRYRLERSKNGMDACVWTEEVPARLECDKGLELVGTTSCEMRRETPPIVTCPDGFWEAVPSEVLLAFKRIADQEPKGSKQQIDLHPAPGNCIFAAVQPARYEKGAFACPADAIMYRHAASPSAKDTSSGKSSLKGGSHKAPPSKKEPEPPTLCKIVRTQPVDTSCPPGLELSADGKLCRVEQRGEPRAVCSEGWKLEHTEGGKLTCSRQREMAARQVCPPHSSYPHESKGCEKTEFVDLVKQCPPETETVPKGCATTVHIPFSYACPPGFARSSNIPISCKRSVARAPEYVCGEGATFDSDLVKCVGKADTASHYCTEGTLEGDMCKKEVVAAPIPW